MNKKQILIIAIILILLLTFIGCNDIQQSELDDLKQENNDLKTELLLQKNLLEDNNKILYAKIEILEIQAKEFESKILTIKELTTLNNYHEDLTDLSTYESLKFEEFRLNYDDKVLIGLEPISICKMYLYASLIKDYETVYELYTTNEGGFFWSKEEGMNIPIKDRMSDFSIVEDVYNLKVIVNEDNKEYATIIWYSENGYNDENIGAYNNGFNLQKDGDVWKVSFVPMQ
jgi:hypothetical protein